MVPLSYYLMLSIALFAIGIAGVVVRRNAAVAALCAALVCCAAVLAFAVGARLHGAALGQAWGALALVVVAAELCVGAALTLALFRRRKSLDLRALGRLQW